jgi:hypothetical protein
VQCWALLLLWGRLLTVFERFDVETERGRHEADIFAVELVENGGFAGIVQTAASTCNRKREQARSAETKEHRQKQEERDECSAPN